MLFLLFSLVDIGLLLAQGIAVAGAAREAARQAAIDGGASGRAVTLGERALAASGVAGGRVTISPARARYGKEIVVTVSAPYRFRFAPLRALAGGAVPVTGRAAVRAERGGRR